MNYTIFNEIKLCAFAFIVFVGIFPTLGIAQQGDRCLDIRSQTQMNACEAERYQKADADLNNAYRKLLLKYKDEPQFIAKLQTAQRAWLKFRDAYLDSIYFKKDKLQAYGSVYPTCKSILLTHLTVERTRELKQMLDPEEGDVCGLSVSSDEKSSIPASSASDKPSVP
ncbi:MAG TPA: lysozyme inhibitor LprI family protein [Terriglobales bacterium]|nr:lysozyme inhibitor LprI family protein [Terriglobales bacterium]